MNQSTIRVLIVEDDPAEATMIGGLLELSEDPCYDIQIAYRPEVAALQFESGTADICLLALREANGNGFELLQQTRDWIGGVPIIIVTNWDETSLPRKAVDCGVQDHINRETISADILYRSVRHSMERHQLQVQLAAACRDAEESRFQQLLDCAEDALLIVDKSGVIVRANELAATLFGHTRDDLLGRNSEALIPNRHRHDRARQWSRYLAEPGIQRIGTAGEQMALRRDGSEIPVEIGLRPLETERELLIAVAVRDVSGRKTIERHRQRFRAALDVSADGIFLIDRRTMSFLHVNETACQSLGYSLEEMLCMGPQVISPQFTKEYLERKYDSLIENCGTDFVQTVHLHRNGSAFPVEVVVRLLDSGEQKVLIAAARDITEQLQANASLAVKEEQLRQIHNHDDVGALTCGVAHEFNNLLQAIRAYTGLVMDELPDDDQRSQDLQQVMEATDRAACLTSQLLDYSRRKPMKAVPLDISAIVVNAITTLRPLLNPHIELRSTIGYDAGTVHADPALIQQVIIILCVNARDAMPNGGKLSIRTEGVELSKAFCDTHTDCSPGPHALLSVSHTGNGLSPLAQSRIFEPFFAADEMKKGSGLGLAIVHGIVRQHRGAIHVSSEPGRDTTFTIYLPNIDNSVGIGLGDGFQQFVCGSETILLVEDENLVREIAVRILVEAGYKVIAAADGATAIRLFHENVDDISLLILDVVMPKMGGRHVYEQIKQVRPALPVLFSTGYDRESLQTKLDDDDKDTKTEIILIEKPYTPQSLLQKVRVVLDNSRSNTGLQLTC